MIVSGVQKALGGVDHHAENNGSAELKLSPKKVSSPKKQGKAKPNVAKKNAATKKSPMKRKAVTADATGSPVGKRTRRK